MPIPVICDSVGAAKPNHFNLSVKLHLSIPKNNMSLEVGGVVVVIEKEEERKKCI